MNLYVSLSGKDFDMTFDCSGVSTCKFALCKVMPPEDGDTCTFCGHGTCLHVPAQKAALEAMKSRITSAVKNLVEE